MRNPVQVSKAAFILLAAAFLTAPIFAGAKETAHTAPYPEAANHVPTTVAAPDDYAAIRSVIGKYIEGGRQGKSEVMRPAFMPQAIIFGRGPDNAVSGGPIQGLFDYIDSHPAAKQLNAQITAVEIAGTIAQVRVELDNWNGARYSDMFQLLKNGNEWKILSKVYHTH